LLPYDERVVRILKRLRADMEERGVLANRPPSFLIECLAYLAEDHHFTIADDDRYDRVKRVLNRVTEKLAAPSAAASLTEINDLKLLFGAHQAWTYNDAMNFVHLAKKHIGGI
jgi:hypothetical protein